MKKTTGWMLSSIFHIVSMFGCLLLGLDTLAILNAVLYCHASLSYDFEKDREVNYFD